MRDWMRLLVFAIVVAIITLVIAPPEPRAAGVAQQTAERPATAAP